MNQYVIQDRSTLDNYALKFYDGEFYWEQTGSIFASPEPIVLDTVNDGNYWKLFIDDGQFAWESTAAVQDDQIYIEDSLNSSVYFKLRVSDGQFNWIEEAVVVDDERELIAIRKCYDFIRIRIEDSHNVVSFNIPKTYIKNLSQGFYDDAGGGRDTVGIPKIGMFIKSTRVEYSIKKESNTDVINKNNGVNVNRVFKNNNINKSNIDYSIVVKNDISKTIKSQSLTSVVKSRLLS